jgi:hypothetical protein
VTELWHAAKSVDEYPPDPPESLMLARRYRELVRHSFSTDRRSLQSEIGSSEIGWECDRRLAYRLSGAAVTNPGDPMAAIFGTGLHLWLSREFDRINSRRFRYLVEYGCTYRGVLGHGDLFDLETATVVDWKSTTIAKIRSMRRSEVPAYYVVQIQHNAAALAADGWQPQAVALKFFPKDSTLDNSWLWRSVPDRAVVDTAIDRVDRLRNTDPAVVPATPGRHCAFCAQYDKDSTDLSRSCPATKGNKR